MENCILGASKKINKLSKENDCDLVGEWKQSIVNHMYWCSSSTPPDQPDLKIAKWLSIVNHIADKHSAHEDPLYQNVPMPISAGSVEKGINGLNQVSTEMHTYTKDTLNI